MDTDELKRLEDEYAAACATYDKLASLQAADTALDAAGDAHAQARAALHAAIDKVFAQEPVAWIEHHKAGDNLCWDDPGGRKTALYASQQPAADAQDAQRGMLILTLREIADAKADGQPSITLAAVQTLARNALIAAAKEKS